MIIDSRKIQQALAELGDTAMDVAINLRMKGIKGLRREPFSCPVANYLLSETGYRVGVSPAYTHDIETPAPVAEFVRSFDLGERPWFIQ